MNPADQRRPTGAGQYYAEYATINNQGGRSGPNRPPDIPQVTAAMQDYTHDYSGKESFKSSRRREELQNKSDRLGCTFRGKT